MLQEIAWNIVRQIGREAELYEGLEDFDCGDHALNLLQTGVIDPEWDTIASAAGKVAACCHPDFQ